MHWITVKLILWRCLMKTKLMIWVQTFWPASHDWYKIHSMNKQLIKIKEIYWKLHVLTSHVVVTPVWTPGHINRRVTRDPRLQDLVFSALLIHMPVFMSFHLRQSQHCIVTLSAVVMSLLPIVTAARGGAELSWSELLEASSQNTVQLLMLSSMSHHLVCVCTVIVTLQTVEMTRTLLISTCKMAILK